MVLSVDRFASAEEHESVVLDGDDVGEFFSVVKPLDGVRWTWTAIADAFDVDRCRTDVEFVRVQGDMGHLPSHGN